MKINDTGIVQGLYEWVVAMAGVISPTLVIVAFNSGQHCVHIPHSGTVTDTDPQIQKMTGNLAD